MRRYSNSEKTFLSWLAGRGLGYKDIAEAFNKLFLLAITPMQVKTFFRYYGLKTGYVSKGKRVSRSTEFKPGHRPQTWVPVGSESQKSIEDYVYIKIGEPNKWRLKHRIIWEAEHGPVPRGHAVIFADRNRRNFDLNNLILVSRSELSTLNKFGRITADPELTRSGVLLTRLNKAIKKKGKTQ